MSDKEIIKYCRKLIQANLSQYTDTNLNALNEYVELSDKNNKKALLRHCIGIKEFLEKLERKDESSLHIKRVDDKEEER